MPTFCSIFGQFWCRCGANVLTGSNIITHVNFRFSCRRMKLKKEIQAIKELNEQEKAAQAAKASAAAIAQQQCEGPPPDSA